MSNHIICGMDCHCVACGISMYDIVERGLVECRVISAVEFILGR